MSAERPKSPSVFLDHNAGAPVDPRVLERFVTVERSCPGNPSASHAGGRAARAALEDARERVARALAVRADEVVFTSGGTESNNLAVRGLGDLARPVLLAAVEHPSVLAPAEVRSISWWRTDGEGRAIIARPDTEPGLICLVHAQNELGTLQPVAAAATLAEDLGAPMFVDAAQTLGRVPLADLQRADAFSLSPHKCGGLRGGGVLVVRERVPFTPLLRGGGQERGLRPGTPSVALHAANALAIELAVREQPERAAAMAAARNAFVAALRASAAEHRVLTPAERALPNTVFVHFAGVDGRVLLPALDLAGILCSQGAACSSGAPRHSRALEAMGHDETFARACVRFSFGTDLAARDAGLAAETVGALVAQLAKKISR